MITVISISQGGSLMLNLNEVPKALLGLPNHFKNPWNFFLQHTLIYSRVAVLLMEAALECRMSKFFPQCLVSMLQLHVSWEELAILFPAKRSQVYLHSSFLSPQQT